MLFRSTEQWECREDLSCIENGGVRHRHRSHTVFGCILCFVFWCDGACTGIIRRLLLPLFSQILSSSYNDVSQSSNTSHQPPHRRPTQQTSPPYPAKAPCGENQPNLHTANEQNHQRPIEQLVFFKETEGQQFLKTRRGRPFCLFIANMEALWLTKHKLRRHYKHCLNSHRGLLRLCH